MARYKLTKGTISRIRKTKKECQVLIDQGYEYIGEVDENLNPIGPKVYEKDEKEELREKAEELELAAPSTIKRWSLEKLREEVGE